MCVRIDIVENFHFLHKTSANSLSSYNKIQEIFSEGISIITTTAVSSNGSNDGEEEKTRNQQNLFAYVRRAFSLFTKHDFQPKYEYYCPK